MTAAIRDFDASQADAIELTAAKAGRRVSVCLPARDEEATVGTVVATVHRLTVAGGGPGLVDEIVVVDDRSQDTTAAVARAAGARVVAMAAGTGSGVGGKGAAMRRALDEATGDLVVFLDADVENAGVHFVTGLLLPLVTTDDVALVKARYRRPLHGRPDEGGRVTELVAKPVLDLLFPHLSGVRQPLAGETAAPRAVLEKIRLADGYGVEIGMLIDVAEQFGVEAIAQVDLGTRVHRNRPLAELRPQATEVMRTALQRAGRPQDG